MCWGTTDKISWTDVVKNEDVQYRIEQERNALHTRKDRKPAGISQLFRRNFLLNHIIEGKLQGKIEVTERRGMRPKQLLDDLRKSQESGN